MKKFYGRLVGLLAAASIAISALPAAASETGKTYNSAENFPTLSGDWVGCTWDNGVWQAETACSGPRIQRGPAALWAANAAMRPLAPFVPVPLRNQLGISANKYQHFNNTASNRRNYFPKAQYRSWNNPP